MALMNVGDTYLTPMPAIVRAGDPSNSKAVRQLLVTLNCEVDLDTQGDWERECRKRSVEFAFPYGTNMDKEAKGVVADEPCFKRRRPEVPLLGANKNKKMYANKQFESNLDPKLTPLMSNLAGLPIPVKEEDFKRLTAEERKELIMKEIQPYGMVGTTAEAAVQGDQFGRADFVCAAGGVVSTYNTGPDTIAAGDLIVAEAPETVYDTMTPGGQVDLAEYHRKRLLHQHIDGIDSSKVLLSLRRYDPTRIVSYEGLYAIFDDIAKKDDADLRKDVDKYIYGQDNVTNLPLIRQLAFKIIKFQLVQKALMDNSALVVSELNGDATPSDAARDATVVSVRAMATNLATPESRKILESLLFVLFSINHEYNSRVWGFALSDAMPTHRIDVKVGAGHYML